MQKGFRKIVSDIFKKLSGKKTFDDRNIQYANGGICLKRKTYENEEMRVLVSSEDIMKDRISGVAEMPFDDIVLIWKSSEVYYQIENKDMEVVLFDLTYGGYSAMPF